MKLNLRRLSFPLVAVIAVLVGTLLGGIAANAHGVGINLYRGYRQDYASWHYHTLGSPTTSTYSFYLLNEVTDSSDGSAVTVHNFSRTNGWNPNGDLYYGYRSVYYGGGSHYVAYLTYSGDYWPVNGQDQIHFMGVPTPPSNPYDWYWNNFGANDLVWTEQAIWRADGGFFEVFTHDYNVFTR